jgi:hypothetical protein
VQPRGAGQFSWASLRCGGAHQIAFAVRARVRAGAVDELRRVLDDTRLGRAHTPGIPFGEMSGVHFGRLILLEDSTDPDGALIPASLLLITEVDAPLERHLDQLANAGPGLDGIFGLCEGYPSPASPEARRRFLSEHMIHAQARYVHTVGRTVDQIRQEAALHDAIQAFLDSRQRTPVSDDPVRLRAEIQKFVRASPELAWATRRAPGPGLRFRAHEALHAVCGLGAMLIVSPVALAVLPVYVLILRMHERRDPAPDVRPTPEHVRELAALEDFGAQNQFSAVGYIKPGLFRRLTIMGVLAAIDYGARHIFNRDSLAGVTSIHFARWTVLDDWRRAIFTSNYDGSHASYMDDFINIVAFGLNASFSNAIGYPKTRFLFWDGARREEEFKDFNRRRQIPTQVWYSAYDQLSTANIDNNALIRSGLFGSMTTSEAQAWLGRL